MIFVVRPHMTEQPYLSTVLSRYQRLSYPLFLHCRRRKKNSVDKSAYHAKLDALIFFTISGRTLQVSGHMNYNMTSLGEEKPYILYMEYLGLHKECCRSNRLQSSTSNSKTSKNVVSRSTRSQLLAQDHMFSSTACTPSTTISLDFACTRRIRRGMRRKAEIYSSYQRPDRIPTLCDLMPSGQLVASVLWKLLSGKHLNAFQVTIG